MKIKIHKNYEAIFADYLKHSTDVVGLKKGSVWNRYYWVSYFLKWLESEGVTNIEDIQPEHSIKMVAFAAKKFKQATAAGAASAIRTFWLYLRMRGIGHPKLADSVPSVRNRRFKSVPSYLTEADEKKLLKNFDLTSVKGKRDFAATLLLLRAGLRSSEITALTLDDINWKMGTISVSNEKNRRRDVLPLLPEVGKAIADYLRFGRPKTKSRLIFISVRGDEPKPIGRSSISVMVTAELRRCNISVARFGAHLMRRTVASRMIQKGASIKEIADVLRHRDLKTISLYTKINMPLLREISAPWPSALSRGGQ